LAAMDVPPGFQKQLEGTNPNPTTPPRAVHQIEIDISRDGRVTIDGEYTTMARLYPAVATVVQAHRRRRESQHIALLADQAAAYDTVIKVLDAARQAGDNDIGFVRF
jgi:biopolymer transport protein ExbD